MQLDAIFGTTRLMLMAVLIMASPMESGFSTARCAQAAKRVKITRDYEGM
jgi:hypothetical protein